MPSNNEFLQALFAEDAPFAHVTDFEFDPSNIPSDKHLTAWKGDWFSRYNMRHGTNQYFTISIFNPDEKGVARRRKALYLRTPVIVLDDVIEKLSMTEVSKLPEPAWVLETSPGSEQWGYILDTPCTDRHRVENLLDGLVANGLAPDGRDPGMKGVTRYVRLPEGYNNKASKLVNGQPFKCNLSLWQPEHRVTLEQLAQPFNVNLDEVRREARVDGAADVPDHPLLNIPDIIHVKEVRSAGRFDIRCPWVDEHTGEDDSGSAIFTNADGSIGFKCHHGACQTRTAADLIRFIESSSPGFARSYSDWSAKRVFNDVVIQNAKKSETIAPVSDTVVTEDLEVVSIESLFSKLRTCGPTTDEAKNVVTTILRLAETMPALEKQDCYDDVISIMPWSKSRLNNIVKDLRKEWYNSESKSGPSFMAEIMFVKELNKFYDPKTQIYYTPEAFQNSFAHKDVRARELALNEQGVMIVDKLDFAPKMPMTFKRFDVVFGNLWTAHNMNVGVEGDCSTWLNHWHTLGWDNHREHHLKWMAYTLLHPEKKINHMLILGGYEGSGKDFLLYPLIEAMGEYTKSIEGDVLLSDYTDHLIGTKHLHINELELGDRREASHVAAKLKPLTAAPPRVLRVNPKGKTSFNVTNIVNVTCTTNSQTPIKLKGNTRRIHAAWTNLVIRDKDGNVRKEWMEFWQQAWQWMENGGVAHCIHYLLNNVDISDFNPGAQPPVTDFLQDIQQASKPDMQCTIEEFIEAKFGAFANDLTTATDMSITIKGASMTHPEMIHVPIDEITPIRIAKTLRTIQTCEYMKSSYGRYSIKLWAIRNVDKYAYMSARERYDLYHEMTCKR